MGGAVRPLGPLLEQNDETTFNPQKVPDPEPYRQTLHEDWPRRVAIDFQRAVNKENGAPSPLRRLAFLKQSMCHVGARMARQMARPPPVTLDDRLGITMAFLRAVEAAQLEKAKKLADIYPVLHDLVDVSAPFPHASAGLQKVRNEAIQLARDSLEEDMRSFWATAAKMPEPVKQSKRQQFATRVCKLTPGASSAVKAIRLADGTTVIEAEAMAKALAAHWRTKFTRSTITHR